MDECRPLVGDGGTAIAASGRGGVQVVVIDSMGRAQSLTARDIARLSNGADVRVGVLDSEGNDTNRASRRQGLTLVHFSAESVPFLSLKTVPKRLNAPSHAAVNTP